MDRAPVNFRQSLRFRVSVALALICAFLALAFGGLRVSLEWFSPYFLFTPLDDEMGMWIEEGRTESAFFRWSAAVDEAPSPAELEALIPLLDVGSHVVEFSQVPVDILIEEEDGVRYAVVFGDRQMVEREEQFIGIFLLVILGATVLCGAFGFVAGSWLSDAILAPLGQLTRRLGREQEEDGARLGEDSWATDFAEDEVGLLATAFDGYRSRLSAVLERERAFVADAAHELRNGVAAISSSVEVMIDVASDAKQLDRLHRLKRSCDRLGEFSRILLVSAREGEAERLDGPRPIDRLLEDVVQGRRARAEQRGVTLRLAVEDGAELDAPDEVLDMVIGNLLDNALSHAESRVDVRLERQRLTIEDDGPGLPEPDVGRVFGRGERGKRAPDGGFGLGLAVVRRLCDRYGWSVELKNRPATEASKGAVARVKFGPDG